MQVNQAELVDALTEAMDRAAQHAHEAEGWTGEITVIVLGALGVGMGLLFGWFVKAVQKQMTSQQAHLEELQKWRAQVVEGQLETTTAALKDAASKSSSVTGKLAANTTAIENNTAALDRLKQAIHNAPCGEESRRAAMDGGT